MSEVLPTIKVKHKKYGIEMVINEKDFDKDIHELMDKKAKAAAKVEEKAKAAAKVEEEEEAAKLKALMGDEI